MILTLWILNRAGSLVHFKKYKKDLDINEDECLELAGIFHTIDEISRELTPLKNATLPATGIRVVKCESFNLYCKTLLTGLKAFMTTTIDNEEKAEKLLTKVLFLYVDFALKNAFYEIDMPVNCSKFFLNLRQIVEEDGRLRE